MSAFQPHPGQPNQTFKMGANANEPLASVLTMKMPFPLAASDHIANSAGSKSWQPTTAAVSSDTTTPPSSAILSGIPISDAPDTPSPGTAKKFWRTTPSAQDQPADPRPGRIRVSAVMMIAIIVVALVILSALCFTTFTGALGGRVDVNPDPLALVRGQLSNNHNAVIDSIGYDSAITFEALGPYIVSVNVKDLAPLSNNYLARTSSDFSSQAILIDETAVGRIISLNSNWVAYLDGKGDAVFNDVAQGSRAEQFINAYNGYQIVFHRLAFGEIYVRGSDVYVLTQLYYTIIQGGRTLPINDVFLYKLTKAGNTLVVGDIEQIKFKPPAATGAAPATEGEPETEGAPATEGSEGLP